MRFTVVVRKSESLPSICFIEYCTIFFTELLNVEAKMTIFIADHFQISCYYRNDTVWNKSTLSRNVVTLLIIKYILLNIC